MLGGNRIPFARSDGAYADASNQDMLTAALDGLVDRFGLADDHAQSLAGQPELVHQPIQGRGEHVLVGRLGVGAV